MRSLITETEVERIFIDTSVQRLLKTQALYVGEDPDSLDAIFQHGHAPLAPPIIIHEPGHDTHLHVRFASWVYSAPL